MVQVVFDVADFVDSRYPEGSESVKNWMGRLSPGTAEDSGYILLRWINWLREGRSKFRDFSPDELVEFQQSSDNGSRYDILDEIQKYVGGLDLRAHSKTKNYSGIRSFFLHNRSPLPEDPSFTIRSDIPPVKGRLTLDIFKRVIMTCNECYRAMFTCMFQGGMGISEIMRWSEEGYGDLVKQLKMDPEHIRIDISGRKHSKNKEDFYTFIGRDAISALGVWLRKRPDRVPIYHEEDMGKKARHRRVEGYREVTAIFVSQYGTPPSDEAIRLYWTRKLKRLGYIEKPENADTGVRYGLNPHELRDLFRSRWRVSGVDPDIAEFFMGHMEALDKLGYDKSPWQYPQFFEEQYDVAQDWLNVFTEDPERVSRDEVNKQRRRIAELEAKNRELRGELGRRDDRLSRLEQDKTDIASTLQEVLKRLGALELQKTRQ